MRTQQVAIWVALGMATSLLAGCRVESDKHGDSDNVKISTPFGGVQVRTNDAVVLEGIGLPAYPGAQLVKKDKDNDAANKTTVLADIDFFPFPFFGNSFDAENALDAPIDIWMASAKSQSLQADLANAKAYLAFWAKGSTQVLMYKASPGFIPAASDADTSGYDVLTAKAVAIVSKATKITQFLDRDTRPDFAGTNGVGSFFLNFLKNPSQDLTAFQKTIQDFWDKLPAYTGAQVDPGLEDALRYPMSK